MPRPKKLKREIRQQAKDILQQMVQQVTEEEEARDAERVPGKVVRGLKTTWTPKDVEKVFPIVIFTPEENMPVTYNGIVYQLITDQEMHVPSIVKDIYERSRKRTRAAGQALRALGITVEVGVGGLPPS